MFRRIGFLLPTLAVVGCGALFNSGPASVMFTSNPSGAEVWVNGANLGTTPLSLDLAKNQSHQVEFRLRGYQSSGAVISRRVSGGFVILDILGGLIPVIIDAATGSWYTLSQGSVHGTLQRTTSSGTLTPDQLQAVKDGTPAEQFIQVRPAEDAR